MKSILSKLLHIGNKNCLPRTARPKKMVQVEDSDMNEHLGDLILDAEELFVNYVGVLHLQDRLPPKLTRLEELLQVDKLWDRIVYRMITHVDRWFGQCMDASCNYYGPAFLVWMLEGTPLPTTTNIETLVPIIDSILRKHPLGVRHNLVMLIQRNACIVYAFLAERMAGTFSAQLMTPVVVQFLVETLEENFDPAHTLYALHCLHKLAILKENKDLLTKHHNIGQVLLNLKQTLRSYDQHGLYDCSPYQLIYYQVTFLTQWLLDNVFPVHNRRLSYRQVDYSNLAMILDHQDKTDGCQLSPNGLSIRSDKCSFECARATHAVSSGVYYYEAVLVTDGIMQIGWATKDYKFNNDAGQGVGDDQDSIAFDGCRQYIWHDSTSHPHNLHRWRAGDVVGCLIDFDRQEFVFYLNGERASVLGKFDHHFSHKPYSPAISLRTFQQCYFNFGQLPFRHPPADYKLNNLNDQARLHVDTDMIRVVPIHVTHRQQSTPHHSMSFTTTTTKEVCTICCDRLANARLKPCNHDLICIGCIEQLNDRVCPFCRRNFTHFQMI